MTKPEWIRLWELSRLREAGTSAGQYAVGFLLAGVLFRPAAWVGLVGALAAGLFAFTYNTLMDHRIGQTVEGAGKALGRLSPKDVRLSTILCGAGLGVALLVALLLMMRSSRAGGAAFLLFYVLVGFLYSSPTFRWKEIAGLECVSNGLAHALPFFAGYFQFRTPDLLALFYGGSFFFFMFGYYVLHCLEDRAADERAGVSNLCSGLTYEGAVQLAMTMTALAALLFLCASLQEPVLFLFLPFFAAAIMIESVMLGRQDLKRVGQLRLTGRLCGAALVAVLAFRALVW